MRKINDTGALHCGLFNFVRRVSNTCTWTVHVHVLEELGCHGMQQCRYEPASSLNEGSSMFIDVQVPVGGHLPHLKVANLLYMKLGVRLLVRWCRCWRLTWLQSLFLCQVHSGKLSWYHIHSFQKYGENRHTNGECMIPLTSTSCSSRRSRKQVSHAWGPSRSGIVLRKPFRSESQFIQHIDQQLVF